MVSKDLRFDMLGIVCMLLKDVPVYFLGGDGYIWDDDSNILLSINLNPDVIECINEHELLGLLKRLQFDSNENGNLKSYYGKTGSE